MQKTEAAVLAFRTGQSCSQAILSTYGPAYGLSAEQGLSLASGFGGGMAVGETCGAVTGALMVLGLERAPGGAGSPAARAEVKAAVLSFMEQFKAKHGTIVCKRLLDCDISTSEGLASARSRNLFATVCPGFVCSAAEILDRMLAPGRQQA